MKLNFKNKEIFFSVESIWPSLHHRFQTHLSELVEANDDADFLQEVDVPEVELCKLYAAVSSQPEGVASVINAELEQSLMAQLMPLHNLSFNPGGYFEPGDEEPNEAGRVILNIQQTKAANKEKFNFKILNGKTQILS